MADLRIDGDENYAPARAVLDSRAGIVAQGLGMCLQPCASGNLKSAETHIQ